MFSSLEKWNYTYELLLESVEHMITIDDPRCVQYEQYVSERLYLRWKVIWITASDAWADGLTYYEFEDMILDWLRDNAKGRFCARNWANVCFEDPRDAMMFKLAF